MIEYGEEEEGLRHLLLMALNLGACRGVGKF